MYVDAQTIVLTAGVITALGVIIGLILKVHKFVLKVESLEIEIDVLKKHHDDDMENIVKTEKQELDEIKAELQLLTYSVLSCLKALRDTDEQSKNINVEKAIKKIEDHLNSRAHG